MGKSIKQGETVLAGVKIYAWVQVTAYAAYALNTPVQRLSPGAAFHVSSPHGGAYHASAPAHPFGVVAAPDLDSTGTTAVVNSILGTGVFSV